MDTLVQKIKDRTAMIGVIGQGYVGLPLSLVFSEAGFKVTGFDVDKTKIQILNRGESYIDHVGKDRVAMGVTSGRYRATSDFEELAACDAIMICVPTPLGRHREPDNSYIHATAKEIQKRLRIGQIVILESTTYPGTTDEEVLPILLESGLTSPADFLLAFSPEREDPGNQRFSTRNIPKIVGGINPESTDMASLLYRSALETVVPVTHSRVAESCKLLENVFRSVNIALVNELKMTFMQMGIDVWEVIEAASTKPFGYMPFYPGPGLGGHCIPLDPFYLSWKAAEYGTWARFIELAGEINTQMPKYVISRVAAALNEDGKSLKGSRILVLGLAYKANIDDDRESPSYELLEILAESGAQVQYCDPHFSESRKTRKYDLKLKSIPCTSAAFAKFDAVVIATAHDQFKDPALYSGVRLLIDTRNVISPLVKGNSPSSFRLVKA
jgi:UDP-N-acetyl-D-glucosamine dehydrogenase